MAVERNVTKTNIFFIKVYILIKYRLKIYGLPRWY